MDNLFERYKELLSPIQKGLSGLVQHFSTPRTAAQNSRPLINTSRLNIQIGRPRSVTRGQQGIVQQAYRSSAGQQIANIRMPGSGRTLAQAVRGNLDTGNLPKQLASGKYFSGNIPQFKGLDRNLAQPLGQALQGLGEVGTFGLLNFGAKDPDTTQAYLGRLGGQGVGFLSSIALGGGPIGSIGMKGEQLTRTLTQGSRLPQIAQRVAPAIGAEVAQTGSLTAAKTALGQDFDARTDLAFGLGGRGLFGAGGRILQGGGKSLDDVLKRGKALGIKNVSPRANNIHPDDYSFMHEFNNEVAILPKGANMTSEHPLLKQAQELAGHYFGKKWANSDSKTLKKLFDWGIDLTDHLPRDQRAPLPGLPGSGFASNLIDDDVAKAGNINLNRMNVSKTAKKKIVRQVGKTKQELEQIRGEKLTGDEVLEAAKEADVLKRVVTREDTKRFNAQLTKLRQAVAAGSKGKGVTPEFLESLQALSSQATDAGRRLQSFSIGADPLLDSTKTRLIARLQRLGFESDEILQAAKNVDFDDNRQATAFYRQFVKPKLGEILEEYRYMNLLSSPRTHIVNVFSNTIQSAVTRPATRTMEALIDPVAAALQGRKREVYLREVPAYYRGYLGAIPEAFQRVKDVFSGKQQFTNLDLERIPTNTRLSKLNVVTKGLEAMDQFFQTLVRGAETAALTTRGGLDEEEIAEQAFKAGEYTVFRQGLKTEGQGGVLNWVDKGTEVVLRLRKVPGMGWFIPFIQTPMNIFKQGIEYSPIGVATTIGAANKTEQLSKAAIGSMVFAGAGYLALQDRLTWKAPKDNEQRKAFYAAGMQPYSVKVGDKWISFSKMGPLAYPMALAAAIKYAYEDNPEAVASGDFDKLSDSLTGIMGFFGDQSYMQGIGDMVNAVEGQEGYGNPGTRAIGNIVGQYVPLASLQRWVTQVVDPVYRKGDSVMENITKGIPGLSTGVSPYEDPLGDPSQRQFPLLNAVSPLSVTEEKPEFRALYEARQQNLEQNAITRAIKEGKDVSPEAVARSLQGKGVQVSTREADDFPFPDYARSAPGQTLRADIELNGKGNADIVFHLKTPEGKVVSVPQTKEAVNGQSFYGLQMPIPDNIRAGTGEVWVTVNGKEVDGTRRRHEIVQAQAIDRYKRTPDNQHLPGTDMNHPTLQQPSIDQQTVSTKNKLDEKIQKYELNAAVERIRISEEPEWIGDTFVYKDEDSVKKIKTSELVPEIPEFTGRKELDDDLYDAYSSAIGRKVNDVRALYEQGQITADQAEGLIQGLYNQRTQVKARAGKGGKGKKGKKIKISLPKAKKQSSGVTKIKEIRRATPRLKKVSIKGKGSVPRVTPRKKKSAVAAIRATQIRS